MTQEEGEILAQATPDDLVEYGMIPELVGRLPLITTLNPLSIDILVRILTEPRNALCEAVSEVLRVREMSARVLGRRVATHCGEGSRSADRRTRASRGDGRDDDQRHVRACPITQVPERRSSPRLWWRVRNRSSLPSPTAAASPHNGQPAGTENHRAISHPTPPTPPDIVICRHRIHRILPMFQRREGDRAMQANTRCLVPHRKGVLTNGCNGIVPKVEVPRNSTRPG